MNLGKEKQDKTRIHINGSALFCLHQGQANASQSGAWLWSISSILPRVILSNVSSTENRKPVLSPPHYCSIQSILESYLNGHKSASLWLSLKYLSIHPSIWVSFYGFMCLKYQIFQAILFLLMFFWAIWSFCLVAEKIRLGNQVAWKLRGSVAGYRDDLF